MTKGEFASDHKIMALKVFIFILSFSCAQISQAKVVGRRAAQAYMGVKPDHADSAESKESSSPNSTSWVRYMQIYAGGFLTDKTYNWGGEAQKNKGNWFLGFNYRLGEWNSTADFSLRVEYQTFELNQGPARKLSTTFLFTLPDAPSKFPVYFGVALGPGFFLKQIKDESTISLDYQLLLGIRLFDMIDSGGFFIETGIKDHILLLSDGQFSEGFFMSAGAVFTF